ncbi:MAG TPA: hypothetical protein VKS22_11345 [Candidatus Binataceae bacterium]|nr:hypothetical protein [Candidatus Binataceae bacterium]
MVVREDPEATTSREAQAAITQQRFTDQLLSRLNLADFMAVLMVAATAFSAFATWRTASIANAIYAAAERAYFGLESTTLDASRPGHPRVVIDYRNLGDVSATNLKIIWRLIIDGEEVKSTTKIITPGILSPGTQHLFRMPIPPAAYASIVAGKSSLEVQIAAAYNNLRGNPLCYMAKLVYDAEEKDFDITNGTLDCAAQRGLWP